MKRTLQALPSRAQQPQGHGHVMGLPDDLLTTIEAAARLRYDGPRAVANFFLWANRHHVPRFHRGSRVLWSARVLLAFLNREPWTRVHADSLPIRRAARKPHSVACHDVAGSTR